MRMPKTTPGLALSACLAVAGCSSVTETVSAVRPDGGATLVFDKPYETVFPAAVRVMVEHGEQLREALPETGRVISAGDFQSPRGVFLTRLPHSRTRVELTSNFTGGLVQAFAGGPEGFFAALREQIVVYEKMAVFEEEQKRIERMRRRAQPQNQGQNNQAPASAATPKY